MSGVQRFNVGIELNETSNLAPTLDKYYSDTKLCYFKMDHNTIELGKSASMKISENKQNYVLS